MNDRSTLHPSTRSRVPGLSTMKPLALLVHALCLGALSSLAGAPAHAQTAGQPESLRHYAIPAGPLEATLNRLGREAGLLIAFGSAATEGLRSGGVSGSYTVDDALARALAGTGLAAVRTAGGGYALRAATASAAGAAADAGGSGKPMGQGQRLCGAAGQHGHQDRRLAAGSAAIGLRHHARPHG
ncbi:STN domain-containing protein [Janthinobacterium sp.]|uniref:STN domain-containing protein n=1 Tax=Janthinobacterium sp. TaxID=1871054 RepID=UPI00258CE565|nr:STN domain-containing protein [Janthinobacterium sp.]MCX7289763.1 STN domain-containing protein [Janthinobacterium sp.]